MLHLIEFVMVKFQVITSHSFTVEVTIDLSDCLVTGCAVGMFFLYAVTPQPQK